MDFIRNLISKALPKNLAGIIGLVQVIIPLVRELVMVIIRILAILMPKKVDDDLIVSVKSIADKIEGVFEKVKSFFLPEQEG